MRKDVREALQAKRIAEPARPSKASLRRGPRDTGMRSADKAAFCRGCGCVVNRTDGYRTSKGIWCPSCAPSFNGSTDVPAPNGEAPVEQTSEESWLRPTGLLSSAMIKALRPRLIPKPSTTPIADPLEAPALGIRKQKHVPCSCCGALINGTPYHLRDGRYCADCVFRAGQAEERRERSYSDYIDQPREWSQVDQRPAVGTRLHAGDLLFDQKRGEWREVVHVMNGHDVAVANSPDWWMWNPERAFRFTHGELFRDADADGRWRTRPVPPYVAPYFSGSQDVAG